MATKQSTQLCYQINGGTCQNKVSAKNSYVCDAGHRAIKNMGTDGAAIQLPVEAVAKMEKYAQRRLAMNPMIGADVAQALFDTEDERIRHNLARNPSIDREMMKVFFDTGDEWVRHNLARNPSIDREMMKVFFDTGDLEVMCNLAWNPSIDHDMAQALFDTRDKGIWSGLARNPSIDRDIQQALFNAGDGQTRRNLATNPSIDREMAQALFDTGDEWVKRDLATNPSIDREMAIALAKDGHAPIGYLENKSITELCERENISLLNEHPKEFGRAYLDHLLKLDKNLEEMKALLCYSYDCYRKASYSSERYKGQILEKYPNDEEVKILLS